MSRRTAQVGSRGVGTGKTIRQCRKGGSLPRGQLQGGAGGSREGGAVQGVSIWAAVQRSPGLKQSQWGSPRPADLWKPASPSPQSDPGLLSADFPPDVSRYARLVLVVMGFGEFPQEPLDSLFARPRGYLPPLGEPLCPPLPAVSSLCKWACGGRGYWILALGSGVGAAGRALSSLIDHHWGSRR